MTVHQFNQLVAKGTIIAEQTHTDNDGWVWFGFRLSGKNSQYTYHWFTAVSRKEATPLQYDHSYSQKTGATTRLPKTRRALEKLAYGLPETSEKHEVIRTLVVNDSIDHKGSSRNFNGDAPTAGYMVSTKEHEVKAEGFGDFLDRLRPYIVEKLPVIESDLSLYIGTWPEDEDNQLNGMWYMDVSRNVATLDEALTIARANGQIAIWDVVAKKEIRLADMPAESQSGKQAASVHESLLLKALSDVVTALERVKADMLTPSGQRSSFWMQDFLNGYGQQSIERAKEALKYGPAEPSEPVSGQSGTSGAETAESSSNGLPEACESDDFVKMVIRYDEERSKYFYHYGQLLAFTNVSAMEHSTGDVVHLMLQLDTATMQPEMILMKSGTDIDCDGRLYYFHDVDKSTFSLEGYSLSDRYDDVYVRQLIFTHAL